MGKLFGTDGVRGRANNGTVNPFVIPKIGVAVGTVFSRGKEHHRYRALLGKDTRLSNYMIEDSIISGLVSVGMDVEQIGPMPTPAVAYLTESMRMDVGIMLTASHNQFDDNGIKFFGPDGYKLAKTQEEEIENLVFSDISVLAKLLAVGDQMGRAKRIDEEKGQYKNFVKNSLSKKISFAGLRVVVDCANGAAYQMAPQILNELDAEVISICFEPNGTNINKECGSTHPELISREVRKYRADLGIALDGDGDRVLLVDETGKTINGDQLLAMIACSWKEKKLLSKPVVVGTSMSNLGFERYLRSIDLELVRTDVGDQNILRLMREEGYNVGGEESGHIILSELTKTGDGIAAALQAMVIIKESGRRASEVCHLYKPVPQILENVRFNAKLGDPLEEQEIKAAIESAQQSLGSEGRVLVRRSGTEPLIRIMVESDDRVKCQAVVDELKVLIVSKVK